ncbi:MAG: response regulator, partial [Spirochaetes bacterium]|nr:response regulator [Spirochaetota bacterium]
AAPGAVIAGRAEKRAGGPERSGRILVIDDEKFILKVSSGILESRGWDVLTAESAESALEIFATRWETITAVVIDLSMPGMSGLDLFLKLKAIDPGVKAVLCSGMLDNEVRKAALEIGMRDAIQKPYDVEKLLEIIEELTEE